MSEALSKHRRSLELAANFAQRPVNQKPNATPKRESEHSRQESRISGGLAHMGDSQLQSTDSNLIMSRHGVTE